MIIIHPGPVVKVYADGLQVAEITLTPAQASALLADLAAALCRAVQRGEEQPASVTIDL